MVEAVFDEVGVVSIHAPAKGATSKTLIQKAI